MQATGQHSKMERPLPNPKIAGWEIIKHVFGCLNDFWIVVDVGQKGFCKLLVPDLSTYSLALHERLVNQAAQLLSRLSRCDNG